MLNKIKEWLCNNSLEVYIATVVLLVFSSVYTVFYFVGRLDLNTLLILILVSGGVSIACGLKMEMISHNFAAAKVWHHALPILALAGVFTLLICGMSLFGWFEPRRTIKDFGEENNISWMIVEERNWIIPDTPKTIKYYTKDNTWYVKQNNVLVPVSETEGAWVTVTLFQHIRQLLRDLPK